MPTLHRGSDSKFYLPVVWRSVTWRRIWHATSEYGNPFPVAPSEWTADQQQLVAVQRLVDVLHTRLQWQKIEMDDAWWSEHRRILWDFSELLRLFKWLDEQSKQERDGADKAVPQQQQMAYGFRVVP